MAKRGVFHISLARKCQLLFGLAVVLILAAALFVPGYYMETFVHELNARRARQLAMLARARLDPANTNWQEQAAALHQWWEVNARSLKLPAGSTPRLIQLPTGGTTATTGVTAEQARELVNMLEEWVRRLRVVADWVGRPGGRPWKWEVPRTVWRMLPETARSGAGQLGAELFWAAARAKLANAQVYPKLDEYQLECVREMRENETITDRTTWGRRSDGSMVYRVVLAVRGTGEGPASRPLLGLIDVELAEPEMGRMLLVSRAVLVLAGVLAGFLAILVFYLISHRLILAPVRELTAVAGRIGGGDLSARSAIATGDEFEELSDAFNDMLGRLERARSELEAANRSLDAKLGELAAVNVGLFESNRLKSEFLANVSHEFRTPLTSIIGFADLLRDAALSNAPVDSARLARYAHNILTSGRGLLDMINDLLDLAKIEARRIELHRAPFSVRDVCEALIDLERPMAEKKNLTLVMELSDDLPMMNSDAGKLRQVLFNLLSNALKYTPEGGTVRLEGRALDAGQRLRLTVADSGPGIAPEDQERIFEKFRQLDSSVTREHGGSGLGLAISKELCTLLGGTIRVESELGQGSRFIVELPVECPEAADRALPTLT